MHLHTILAFALLFWRTEEPGRWRVVGENDVFWTLAIVLSQPLLLGTVAALSARRTRRLIIEQPDAPQAAQQLHHRAMFFLRIAVLAGFAVAVLLTHWPDWFAFGKITPALQIVGDLIVLSPFLVGVVVIWLAAYRIERTLRGLSLGWPLGVDKGEGQPWRLRSYLDFNLRHHVLVVAVPMTMILFAANLTRGYESPLQSWTGWIGTPDVILGVVAAGVFTMAPIMLTRIWHTAPLQRGLVRERLEAICDRIGLRCRTILVWHSDGMMINAAVMGIFTPVRFVLLSDALLATMDVPQIEAVFGHEAGHVRRRHIPYFLVFAYIGWLLAAGVMELLARTSTDPDSTLTLSAATIQGIGVVATVLFWGIGFGWLSRRFERQADLFGAWCVTPTEAQCHLPCSVHLNGPTQRSGDGRVCATGAAIFASALDRVAVLNGIPHEERSWRHSSIGSRIRFLTSLAGDPGRAAGFERLMRRVKITMLAVAIIGSVFSVYYWMVCN
ncbi:MAG: M48 family metallopeptidase [Phycisphaerae bacterium]